MRRGQTHDLVLIVDHVKKAVVEAAHFADATCAAEQNLLIGHFLPVELQPEHFGLGQGGKRGQPFSVDILRFRSS